MAPKRATKVASDDAAKKRKGGVAVGDHLPEFELETDESTAEHPVVVKSSDVLQGHGAVFFFYPKANTGGCTKQACGFRDHYTAFEMAGYKVYGVSADRPSSQLNWKKKHSFPYNLLSDVNHQFMTALGVSNGSSIKRSHVLVEKGGRIRAIHIGVKPVESVEAAVATIAGVPAAYVEAGTEPSNEAAGGLPEPEGARGVIVTEPQVQKRGRGRPKANE